MAKKKQSSEAAKRKRRSIDERIAALQAKIASIKEREARKQISADPALRHARAALKAVDRALPQVSEPRVKHALSEARTWLSAALDGSAETSTPTRGRRSAEASGDLSNALLAYVRSNPGQRGEQIAAALGADTATIRPVMKRLIADGKVATEGQKRGMTYSAV